MSTFRLISRSWSCYNIAIMWVFGFVDVPTVTASSFAVGSFFYTSYSDDFADGVRRLEPRLIGWGPRQLYHRTCGQNLANVGFRAWLVGVDYELRKLQLVV